tara:strand:- start:786 stop:1157 length:372 start_codon:yes stop_codon:yes gene_type:complete
LRLVLALIVLLGGCVAAPVTWDHGQCFKDKFRIDRFLKDQKAFSAKVQIHLLTPIERENFLKAWNTHGQPTGFMFDKLYKFFVAEGRNVIMVFVEDGCVWTTALVPAYQYRFWTKPPTYEDKT